jgi:hypothetical protein
MQCDDAGRVSVSGNLAPKTLWSSHARIELSVSDEVGLVHRDIDGSHGNAPMCTGQEAAVSPAGRFSGGAG